MQQRSRSDRRRGILRGASGVGEPQRVARRNDVENRQLRDLVRMIEGQAMSDAAAPVMSDDGESIETEVLHDFEIVFEGFARFFEALFRF